jgi:hypothetical protein
VSKQCGATADNTERCADCPKHALDTNSNSSHHTTSSFLPHKCPWTTIFKHSPYRSPSPRARTTRAPICLVANRNTENTSSKRFRARCTSTVAVRAPGTYRQTRAMHIRRLRLAHASPRSALLAANIGRGYKGVGMRGLADWSVVDIEGL